jgi:hypothetical protein
MERVETAETRRIFSFQTFTDYQARNIRSGGHYSGSVRIEAQITKVVYQMPRLNKKRMKKNHGKTFSFGNILPDNWYLENCSLLAAHMMFY